MSDESIFSSATPTPSGDAVPASPVIPQELQELVGEGKKYRSVEDALKSVPHAQSHISKLEAELQAARDELAKRKAAEELLDSFKSASSQQEVTPPASLDQDTLVRTVEAVLSKAEQAKLEKANITKVVSTFNEKFGDKGPEVYEKLAAETGMSLAMLNKMSATSPTAVFKLAGFDSAAPSAPGKPSSSVNLEGLPKTQQGDQNLSAKIPKGATTKDLVTAWRNAGTKVKQNLGIN